MTQYVAFLRGIGPTNPNMRAEKLRGVFERLGFVHIASVLGTGNILFESDEQNTTNLEEQIEHALQEHLGFKSATIIRTKVYLQSLVGNNLFGGVRQTATVKPNITFLKHPNGGPGELAWVVDTSAERTVDRMARLEREYGKDITTRTLGTILKILAKA